LILINFHKFKNPKRFYIKICKGNKKDRLRNKKYNENYTKISTNCQAIFQGNYSHQKTQYLGSSKLKETLAKYTTNNEKYDCLVPMSGGKDSTYVLYQLKEEYLKGNGDSVKGGLLRNLLKNPSYIRPGNMIACVKDYFHNYQHVKDWNIVLKIFHLVKS